MSGKCQHCGRSFTSKEKVAKFCSPQCGYASRVIFHTCKQCGQSFRRKSPGNKKFCSRECYHAFQKSDPAMLENMATAAAKARMLRAQHEVLPHGYRRYCEWQCRCDRCTAAFHAHPDQMEREKRSRQRSTVLAQNRSLDSATRRGYRWTGPELELLEREDLSAKELATLLNRTVYAVKTQRHYLRVDPRKIALAGVPGSGDEN